MIDLFGLGKQNSGDAAQPPSPEAPPEPAAPRGSHKLWAFLLVLDSVVMIVFAGALAAKVYQYWKAPAPPVAAAPRRRPVKAVETPPLASTAPVPAPAAEPVKAPEPAEASGKAASAPAPAPGAPVKAIRTEFKVHAPKAKSVELVGAFIVRGGRKDMIRQDDGSWTVTLYLNPGTYRYFFAVDKKKQLDPENPRSEKGASLLAIP